MLTTYFAERGVAQLSLPSGGVVPLRFSDQAREHLATRRSVGLFDFSFMGWWEVTGRDALLFLQFLQTRNLRELKPGKLCYTLLCRQDGSVFIDATVWCHTQDHYWLFTGRQTDEKYISGYAQGFEVGISPLSLSHSVIAVQGPWSAALLEQMWPGSVADLPYYGFCRRRLQNTDVWFGRLGHTGDLGYEIILPAVHAVATWQRLVAIAGPAGLLECGFEAGNSLRIEAGFILFTYELAQRVFPWELSFMRLVALHRSDFIGGDALRRRGVRSERRLVGIRFGTEAGRGRNVSHPGTKTVNITSEALSPLLECPIALGFVDETVDVGAVVYTEDGRRAHITRLPFYDPPRALARRKPHHPHL